MESSVRKWPDARQRSAAASPHARALTQPVIPLMRRKPPAARSCDTAARWLLESRDRCRAPSGLSAVQSRTSHMVARGGAILARRGAHLRAGPTMSGRCLAPAPPITADPLPSARRIPRSCRGDGWNALAASRSSSSRSGPSWRPWTGSGSACTAAAASRTPPCAAAPDRADLDGDLRRHAVAHRRPALGCSLHHLAQHFRSWHR